jgi:flagella basal body P-ring formation protein FlgA
LVRRGQKVVILAKIEGLRVKMQGIALQDGSQGMTIKVKNKSSRRIIEGTVIRPGTIMVNL